MLWQQTLQIPSDQIYVISLTGSVECPERFEVTYPCEGASWQVGALRQVACLVWCSGVGGVVQVFCFDLLMRGKKKSDYGLAQYNVNGKRLCYK